MTEHTSEPLPDTNPKPSMTSATLTDKEYYDDYSTLEVHQGKYIEHDSSLPPAVRPTSGFGKIPIYDDDSLKGPIITETAVPELSSKPASPFLGATTTESRVLGLRKRTFLAVLCTLIVVVLAAGIGGGLGGAAAHRARTAKAPTGQPSATSNTSVPTTNVTSAEYANIGLAVMQWTDPNGTLYKRVYFQDSDNKIRESGWDNSTDFQSSWAVNTISDAVKPGTPIAAVAGWPHASYNYTLVS